MNTIAVEIFDKVRKHCRGLPRVEGAKNFIDYIEKTIEQNITTEFCEELYLNDNYKKFINEYSLIFRYMFVGYFDEKCFITFLEMVEKIKNEENNKFDKLCNVSADYICACANVYIFANYNRGDRRKMDVMSILSLIKLYIIESMKHASDKYKEEIEKIKKEYESNKLKNQQEKKNNLIELMRETLK